MAVRCHGANRGGCHVQSRSGRWRELEYDVRGTGEPVLLIHGAILADAFVPLLTQPALADDYRLIAYHRRGFAGN